jgi:IS30 family transposase
MTPADHNQIWDYVEAGESFASIAKVIGSRLTTVRDFVAKHDGLRPLPPKPRSKKRSVVEAKLTEFWSPEQIAGWLRVDYPDDESMRVSHEAIYTALYAKQLVARPKLCLRMRRPLRRRRHRRKNQGQGRIRNPVHS